MVKPPLNNYYWIMEDIGLSVVTYPCEVYRIDSGDSLLNHSDKGLNVGDYILLGTPFRTWKKWDDDIIAWSGPIKIPSSWTLSKTGKSCSLDSLWNDNGK